MAASSSPARAKLALRLAAIAEQRRELEQLVRAAAPAREAEAAAAAAVERAEAALQEVRQSAMAHAITELAGGTAGPSPDVARARAAIADAKEREAVAIAVNDEIGKRERELSGDLEFRLTFVASEASAVLWAECQPAARALADRLTELQRELIDKAMTLNFLVGCAPRPVPADAKDKEVIAAHCTNSPPLAWPIAREPGASPTLTKWRAAYELLKTDAGAKLPQ